MPDRTFGPLNGPSTKAQVSDNNFRYLSYHFAAKVRHTQSTGSKDTGVRNFGPKKIPVPKIHYYF